MTITHQATFLLSGAFSSVIIGVKPPPKINPLNEVVEELAQDFIQVSDSTVFLGLGSDASNQPISIYFASESDPNQQGERKFIGTFVSCGEPVYLETIDSMEFNRSTSSFFVPMGRYILECHSWNIQNARDHRSAYIYEAFGDVRHHLVFIPA